jgi:hypothetical protein
MVCLCLKRTKEAKMGAYGVMEEKKYAFYLLGLNPMHITVCLYLVYFQGRKLHSSELIT